MNVHPGGILTGDEINAMHAIGAIEIEPFDKRCLNAVSVDLHLGSKVAIYTGVRGDIQLDAKEDNPVRRFNIPDEGLETPDRIIFLSI